MSDLLPLNATPQERAVSVSASRIDQVPVLVREMWDADACPVDLLPWLAWAFSVDEWNPGWTEEQKRQTIKNSVSIHRRKGTIGAIKTALDSLGYDLTVVEWFQKSPVGDPYTFGIEIAVDQIGIEDDAAYDQIERVANSAKNLRSHLDVLNVRGNTGFTEYFAAKVISGDIVNISAEPS